MYGNGAGIGMTVVFTAVKRPTQQVGLLRRTASYVAVVGTAPRLAAVRRTVVPTRLTTTTTTTAFVWCGLPPRYNPIL